MKTKINFLTLLAVAGVASTATAGDLTGKINFKGDVAPAPRQISFDAMCGKLHSEASFVELVKVRDGGLDDVFVYVKEGLPAKEYEIPSEPVILDQVDCIYTPYVFGIQQGRKLEVKNSDMLLHNVNVTDLKFNRAQLPKGPAFEFTFDEEHRFLRFKCDVHPWMFAYANVVPHPYFATSAKGGAFTIKGLPEGEYTIEAIHRRLGAQTAKVKVGADGATTEFTFEAKN